MTYIIYVTPNGEIAHEFHNPETVKAKHINHNLEDIEPYLRASVSMMDAACEWSTMKYTQAVTLEGVGTKVFYADGRPCTYYVKELVSEPHK